ncbi:MAG: Sua5/YciO/YrdC/YwlC family protein [Candidatus Aenigmarchaeota archaeon]|nr:Sua5/YciO/YrdC/YwlC family protein [Candidatus Aenigmarchaeota archaeon]MDW8149033.1 Sua5/YciO/YrdC/YwlC family protein [Candidatus Aenigmarchaeota archaeon]
MKIFERKVLEVVKNIKKGSFKTYKEVAKLAGKGVTTKMVTNILNKNKHKNIPIHRVVKSDYTIGKYPSSWKKLALLLKEGVIAVMPTDTIYGICGSALNKLTVEKIYKIRKRSPNKPMIILISRLKDLKVFGINPTRREINFLKKVWPGKISVILNIKNKNSINKFKYLHRGTNSLAFRLPKPKWLRNVLKISGPIVAPSANWESYTPAKNIKEAKKYFGKKVVYYNGGNRIGEPSILIRILRI